MKFSVEYQVLTSPPNRRQHTQVVYQITPAFTPGPDFKDMLPEYIESIKHFYTTSDMTAIEVIYPDFVNWYENGWWPTSEDTPGAVPTPDSAQLADIIATKLSFPSHILPR